MFMLPWPSKQAGKQATLAPDEVATFNDVELQAVQVVEVKKAPKPRMIFLDHLKTMLTCVVVLHHITTGFAVKRGGFGINFLAYDKPVGPYGLWGVHSLLMQNSFVWGFAACFQSTNDMYFMALFFFISGLFTPSSFDRKGAFSFLQDKFKRLGVPVVASYFVLMPLLDGFTTRVVFEGSWNYPNEGKWIQGGPAWFISWLLIFNILYAFNDGEALQMKAPSVGVLLTVGFAIGLWQLPRDVGTAAFMNVPFNFADLPLYVLSFYGGAIAKRNTWLEDLCERPPSARWLVRIIAAMLLVEQYLKELLMILVPSENSKEVIDPREGATRGVKAIVYCFVLLEVFQLYMNRSLGRLAEWCSQAAYTVYIIHPWVVILVQLSWLSILRALDVNVTVWSPGEFFIESSRYQALTWLGFVYTSVVTTVIIWPLSYGLSKLPGFNQVL